MKIGTLAIIVVIIVVSAVAYVAVTSTKIIAKTNDTDYEATITVHYSDGSTEQVQKFFAQSMKYNDKYIDSLDFSIDAKWKPKVSDVKVLSSRTDQTTATALRVIEVYKSGDRTELAKYPLSYYTQADYSDLTPGDWYHMFKDVKTTVAEIEAQGGLAVPQGDWHLEYVLDVWYSIDTGSKTIKHHQVTVDLAITTMPGIIPPDNGGGGGDGRHVLNIAGLDVRVREYGSTTVDAVPWAEGAADGGSLGKR